MKSLAKQCQWYIFMHMEEFPTSSLSFVPLSTREKLLRRLPVADVCLLEDTSFMKGIDMGHYWNIFTFETDEMHDTEYLLQEMGKDQFCKTIFYDAVVSCYFGLAQGFYLGQPFVIPQDTIKLLYGSRSLTPTDDPRPIISLDWAGY